MVGCLSRRRFESSYLIVDQTSQYRSYRYQGNALLEVLGISLMDSRRQYRPSRAYYTFPALLEPELSVSTGGSSHQPLLDLDTPRKVQLPTILGHVLATGDA